jgi:hypothetical protein
MFKEPVSGDSFPERISRREDLPAPFTATRAILSSLLIFRLTFSKRRISPILIDILFACR